MSDKICQKVSLCAFEERQSCRWFNLFHLLVSNANGREHSTFRKVQEKDNLTKSNVEWMRLICVWNCWKQKDLWPINPSVLLLLWMPMPTVICKPCLYTLRHSFRMKGLNSLWLEWWFCGYFCNKPHPNLQVLLWLLGRLFDIYWILLIWKILWTTVLLGKRSQGKR